MVMRFYTNAVSQASRAVASTIIIVGMLLIGFAILIMALPELFAFLAAAVFFVAGLGCGITGIKIFWAQRQVERYAQEPPQVYRQNVRIRTGHHDDL
jgi:hypothetical protein